MPGTRNLGFLVLLRFFPRRFVGPMQPSGVSCHGTVGVRAA